MEKAEQNNDNGKILNKRDRNMINVLVCAVLCATSHPCKKLKVAAG